MRYSYSRSNSHPHSSTYYTGVACVVDENVAAAVPGHERLGEGIRARSVAHLQWHVLGAAANLRRRVLATSGVAAAEHDHTEEAAVHEALRDVVADSLVGAGHHGDASGDHLSVGDLGLRAVSSQTCARCWQGPAGHFPLPGTPVDGSRARRRV